MSNLID